MKKLFIMLILLKSALILVHELDEPDQTEGIPYTINFNINFANDNHSHCANNAKVDTKQQTNLESLAKDIPDALNNIKSHLSTAFNDYKWHIEAAIGIGSYGLLCYYLMKGNAYFKRSDLWSSWRNELSLDELLAIPHAQFMQDLCAQIQHQYEKDFANCVILFMKAIEQEEKDIKWYRCLYEWTSFFYMRKLTLCDSAAYERCTQRLQRIAYYKGCLERITMDFKRSLNK